MSKTKNAVSGKRTATKAAAGPSKSAKLSDKAPDSIEGRLLDKSIPAANAKSPAPDVDASGDKFKIPAPDVDMDSLRAAAVAYRPEDAVQVVDDEADLPMPVLLQLLCGLTSNWDHLRLAANIGPLLTDYPELSQLDFNTLYTEAGVAMVEALRQSAVIYNAPLVHEIADRALWHACERGLSPEIAKILSERVTQLMQPDAFGCGLYDWEDVQSVCNALIQLIELEAGNPIRLWSGWSIYGQRPLAELVVHKLSVLLDGATLKLEARKPEDPVSDKTGTQAAEDDQPPYSLQEDPEENAEEPDADKTSPSSPETEAPLNSNSPTIEKRERPDVESLVVIEQLPSLSANIGADLVKQLKHINGVALDLVPTPDLSVVYTTLTTMLPHLEQVIERLLTPMAPHASVAMAPTLLLGDPGCGKTTLAEELLLALGVPHLTIDMGGKSDANAFGVSRKWATGAPGVHLDLLLRHQTANIGLILDELEKTGGSTQNGDIRPLLLGLFEPRRAKSFHDPFLEVPIDLSKAIWIATTNSIEGIPAPLLNRLQVMRCPNPGPEHLPLLAGQLLTAEMDKRGFTPQWYAPLTPSELDTLAIYWPGGSGGSIRDLRRYVQAIVEDRDRSLGRA